MVASYVNDFENVKAMPEKTSDRRAPSQRFLFLLLASLYNVYHVASCITRVYYFVNIF